MATQDMPPPGGFAKINIERTFAKPWLKQGFWFVLMAGLSFNGMYVVKEFRKRLRILRIEQMEHFIAVEPFLLAEAERKFLSHLYHVREEEREIMKDVPHWKVGTVYGEPIFKTMPKNTIPPISCHDYFMHRPATEFADRVVLPDQHQ